MLQHTRSNLAEEAIAIMRANPGRLFSHAELAHLLAVKQATDQFNTECEAWQTYDPARIASTALVILSELRTIRLRRFCKVRRVRLPKRAPEEFGHRY